MRFPRVSFATKRVPISQLPPDLPQVRFVLGGRFFFTFSRAGAIISISERGIEILIRTDGSFFRLHFSDVCLIYVKKPDPDLKRAVLQGV